MMQKVKFSTIEQNKSFKVLKADSAAGEVMQPHVADKDGYLFVLSGAIQFKIDNVTTEVGSKNGIHIPAGHAHSFEVTQPSQLLLTLDRAVKLKYL